ncbi:MAG: hypothetical protein AB1696_28445 [Planctomycetota bacterium]
MRQLDALIPFLALSHEDVFRLIRDERAVWPFEGAEDSLPSSYDTYRVQVTHGAFLLGYSYSEAFLADLVREIYTKKPSMLSKDKGKDEGKEQDKQLQFSEILKVSCYKEVLTLMIEKEVLAVFRHQKGMAGVAEYFEKKPKLKWPEQEKEKAIRASLIRNCIIHNLAIADSMLAEVSDYREGDEIALTVSDVHQYGLVIRSLARDLYTRAEAGILRGGST